MLDFEKEVTKYGQSLAGAEQDKAREVFNELLAQGRSFEWLFYAICRLRGRSIRDYPKLLFFQSFADEVDTLMERGREVLEQLYHIDPYKHWRANIVPFTMDAAIFEVDYKSKQLDYELSYYADFLGRGYVEVPATVKDFADDCFNNGFEYELEHKEELMELYNKYWVIPYLREVRIL